MMILILSACVSISLVMSLAFCLCWPRKTSNDDWQGLDGMLTQKNPDENVNHLSSDCVVDGLNSNGDNTDSHKRNTLANTKRSLPDIPSEQGTVVNWEPSGDNSSEHYATVGHYPNSGKRQRLPNGVETRPSVSQHSSISQAEDSFSPYEKVKYDQIKSMDHPYAQVQPNTSRSVVSEECHVIVEERSNLLRPEGASTVMEPAAPNRSRHSSANSNETLDIPASAAVAGGIAASPELPYMTPPVTQANFSGDSQDSSKGYTSISVREPLASIMAQTKETAKSKRQLDPHYSTVSDDSDDVYTTIPDPNNPVYNSESETYSRIPVAPITVEAELNSVLLNQQETEMEDTLYEPPPQPVPPSVDSLKHVASHTQHTHSRQASTSSSVGNFGSPKPEKRQANSPLPPPPTSSFDPNTEKGSKNLDDLYAKVYKNKKEDEKTTEKTDLFKSSSKSLLEEHRAEIRKDHNYETIKKQRISDPGYEKIRSTDEVGYASINGPGSLSSSDPGYEVLGNRALSDTDPNYEQLRHKSSNVSDSGYSRIKKFDELRHKVSNASDSGYSRIKEVHEDSHHKESELGGLGYSQIKEINNVYSTVNKHKSAPPATFNAATEEPNYESMICEPVCGASSDIDLNYECVSHSDPNYESVKDLELPYERLHDDSSKSSDYEKIKTSKISKTEAEHPYKQLRDDTDSEAVRNESISKVSSQTSSSSGNSVDPIQSDVSENLHEEDAIFQV